MKEEKLIDQHLVHSDVPLCGRVRFAVVLWVADEWFF